MDHTNDPVKAAELLLWARREGEDLADELTRFIEERFVARLATMRDKGVDTQSLAVAFVEGLRNAALVLEVEVLDPPEQ